MGESRSQVVWTVGAVVFSLAFIEACNIPVLRSTKVTCCPTSTRPDLRGIKPGTTRLEELQRILALFDTDASRDCFFWARWYQRGSPIGWAGTTGTDPNNEDEFLEWKLINVVAVCDPRGVLTHYRVCSEGDLMRCLQEIAANMSEPHTASPPHLEFRASREASTVRGTDRFHGTLIFEAGQAMLQGTAGNIFRGPHPLVNAHFALTKITQLKVRHGSTQSALKLAVHFKTEVGLDYVQIYASPSNTWRLARLLSSARGPKS